MNYVDSISECGFKDPFNTCINVHTEDFDFNLAFVEFEDSDVLGILVTSEDGREKLKVVNKKYIEYVEIVYADDLNFEGLEESQDKMFG